MNDATTIGIIGLGKMGRPVGRHLRGKQGYRVVGCDPVPEACELAKKEGIEILSSPAEVAAQSSLVMIVVGFDEEVEEVMFGRGGILEGATAGLCVAIGSTISPSYARSVEQRTAGKGITLLDIPSTRGEYALENGDLLILGAGDKDAFERWKPALQTFAKDIYHLGPFGAGQVAKMINNMILWACMTANDEGLRLGEAMGVDPEQLREALGNSSAQNWSLSTRAEERPVPWAEKDMNIVLHEADAARLCLPLAGAVKELIKGYKLRRGLFTPINRGGSRAA